MPGAPDPCGAAAAVLQTMQQFMIFSWIRHYLSLSSRRPFSVLAVLLGVTLLLALGLPRLSLQTRIEALLPENTVSQRSNAEASRRYAGSSPYFLVIQSSDAELNRRLSDQALAQVKKWPQTIWAINARDPGFFLDRRLLFVQEQALAQFVEEVKLYVAFRKCEKMPGCFQLDDEPPEPSFDKLREQLRSQAEVQSLAALFGGETLDRAVGASDENSTDQNSATDNGVKEKSAPSEGRLCSLDGSVCVVQVTLDHEPTNLGFAKELVQKGEEMLESLRPADAPDDLVLAVSGVYRNLPVARAQLMSDLGRTFGLGLGLMVLIIMLQFRRIRALLLLLVPLAFGSVWALGIFSWISPALNLISAAGFIILAGLGIDFGLHLLTHYGAERELGYAPEEAVLRTLEELFSSLSVAALTTACGFLALTSAAFRGFAQLGLFATIGIATTLLAALLTFPPLVLGLHKVRPRSGAFTRTWQMPAFLRRGFGRAASQWITSGGLLLFVASLLLLPYISLRYDLKPLIFEATDTKTHFRDALSGTSRGAVLMLADDRASLEQAAESLREMYPKGLSGSGPDALPHAPQGAPMITLGTFLPPQQDKKLSHIAELADAADEAMRFSDDDFKDKLRPWLPMLRVEAPISEDSLPQWVTNSLRERDGTLGTVGLTYQDYRGSHAGRMLTLSRKLDHLRAENPQVRFASSGAVLGEVMPLLEKDGWRITGLALLGLLLATLIMGRSRRRTLLILTTILLAVSLTAATMVVTSYPIDFYNLLVFPVAFGIGVDGAIYVVWSVLARAGKFEWRTLAVSSRAVFGSTMTTLVMFLSLSTSQNGGLRSLGTVGSIALFVTLVANLFWLPAALSWLHFAVDPEAARNRSRSS